MTHICVGKRTIIGSPSHFLKWFWNIVNWTLRNKLRWQFNLNSNIFIQENEFEHVVWKISAIFVGLNVLTENSDINTFCFSPNILGWRSVELSTNAFRSRLDAKTQPNKFAVCISLSSVIFDLKALKHRSQSGRLQITHVDAPQTLNLINGVRP